MQQLRLGGKQGRAGRQTLTGLSLALCVVTGAVAGAPDDPTGGDPLGSMQWPDLKMQYFPAKSVIGFDERIKVNVPQFAEDAMNVPVSVDASALPDAQKIVILVDRNPIRKVLEYIPLKTKASISFRFKLEQASPIRAAVLDSAGNWHVGNAYINASGGGCTVPGATRKDGSWTTTLNQVSGKLFDTPNQIAGSRLRVKVSHPMDTGLVAGIPAFYIEQMTLKDANGVELAKLFPFEPVSENPLFSFDFIGNPAGPFKLEGRDNNGNPIAATVMQ